MIVKNDLYDYENRFIYQDSDGFKFSVDSILLAEYCKSRIRKPGSVLDMCAGNMAVGLILSKYINSKITGFEIQKEIYKLGIDSIEINNLNDQLDIINDDINNIKNYFSNNQFDVIVCNPPFFKMESGICNTKKRLNIARHEIHINLKSMFSVVKNNLNSNGSFFLVHRPDRLDEIICEASFNGLTTKEIIFINTIKDKSPSIILCRFVKNGKQGLKIKNLCIENIKTYKNIFEEDL